MQVIWNTIKDEHKNKLKELFQGALNFECAVAFAKMSGFSDIKKPLEASLKRGMSARLILGLDFYITDPEVLDMLLGWESRYKVKTYVAKSQSNVCFHPKIYAFSYRNHAIIVAGSANLTGGGFGSNWECSLLVRQQRDNEISGHLQTLIDDAEVDELTAPALADYTRKHRIVHAVRSATEKQIA
ncbi:MAG: phospholipase D family protein [Methylocella sp.]